MRGLAHFRDRGAGGGRCRADGLDLSDVVRWIMGPINGLWSAPREAWVVQLPRTEAGAQSLIVGGWLTRLAASLRVLLGFEPSRRICGCELFVWALIAVAFE